MTSTKDGMNYLKKGLGRSTNENEEILKQKK